jgi:hypothetical protein
MKQENSTGSKNNSGGTPSYSIPSHYPLEDKIRLWDMHNRANAEIADQVTEMISFSAELEHIMTRQPMALRAHVERHGEDALAKLISDGIDGWKAVQKFFNTDCKKIFERYNKNLEYLNDGEFEAHKAWVLAMPDFEKSVKKAFGAFASVLSSLSSQGYALSQFESPSQRLRAALVTAEYNEALAAKRRLH